VTGEGRSDEHRQLLGEHPLERLGEHVPRLHLPERPHEGDEPLIRDAPYADAAGDSPPLERARWRTALFALALLAVGVVMLAIVLADPVDPWFQPFDDWWLDLVEENRNAFFVDVAEVLDRVGSVWVTLPIRVVAVAILLLRRRWLQLSAFVTALALSELTIGPFKAWVDRGRPPSIVDTHAASFPSGHAIATAVTAFGLVAAFLPRGRRRLRWTVAATLLAGSMAWSRTYLGAHWATDTIAGICIGAGIAILSEVAFEEGRRRVAIKRLGGPTPDPEPAARTT
jgi:membrane-associated phospholipid phosphatase